MNHAAAKPFAIFAAALGFLPAFAPAVHAAKPPIPEASLIQMSELVLEARVVSMACGERISRVVGSSTLREQAFVSTLSVVATLKGPPPTPLHYRGLDVEASAGFVGPTPPPPLPVGWQGKLYLVKANATQYETTYDGTSAVEDAGKSQPQPIINCAAADGGAGDGGTDAADGGSDAADGGGDAADAADAAFDGASDGAVPRDASNADVATQDAPGADTTANADARSADTSPTNPKADADGCSCTMGAPTNAPRGGVALLLIGALAVVGRRRRRGR